MLPRARSRFERWRSFRRMRPIPGCLDISWTPSARLSSELGAKTASVRVHDSCQSPSPVRTRQRTGHCRTRMPRRRARLEPRHHARDRSRRSALVHTGALEGPITRNAMQSPGRTQPAPLDPHLRPFANAAPECVRGAHHSAIQSCTPMQARACLRGRTPWAAPNAMERLVSSKI